MATRKLYRDAGNGQFVPKQAVKTRPKTTVTETRKTGKK